MSEWRTIESAPKDGVTPILGYVPTIYGGMIETVVLVHWQGGGSDWCRRACTERGGVIRLNATPSHWMPLPPAPASDGEGTG